jgi:hypothetical protein
MTQADLEREVSRTTGESMGIIRQHGFSILPMPEEFGDDEPEIQIVDWDEQDAIRRRAA